ncbi:MAG TPA: class I SAM-dependent methyltransferase [Steroidobacteraceae bacterium]|jgi:SAM-dependent methyltransferase
MAIGSNFFVLRKKKLGRLVTKLFGDLDVHTHYRVKPLINWVHTNKQKIHSALVIEIGCGTGSNLFEISSRVEGIGRLVGFDLDGAAISEAQRVANGIGCRNVEFFQRNCCAFDFPEKPDVILLMDFLEHIDNADSFLGGLRQISNEETVLVISVPTPRFPMVFGRGFHESIGHVRDGFTKDELTAVLNQNGFNVDSFQYNTGLIASAACTVFYKYCFKLKGKPKALLALALSPMRVADILNGPQKSCSMFVVASPF